MVNQNKQINKNNPWVVYTKHLEIGYKNETIVSDINLEIKSGESLALVGVNGSGKSTLLKSLVGILPVLKGEVNILEDLPGRKPKEIAYLSQFHQSGMILPLKAEDVVRMGRYASHGLLGKMGKSDNDLVIQSMQRMEITHLKNMPLSSLSGGQQQRVYLAQVLAKNAKLIILDEPTAGLDAGGHQLFQNAIREELNRGVSIVMATHDIDEAMKCDQTLLLARKVIAYGKGSEVITSETLMEAFGMVFTLDDGKQKVTVLEREHSHENCSDSGKH